jgi:hypothetical protein
LGAGALDIPFLVDLPDADFETRRGVFAFNVGPLVMAHQR